MPKNNTSKQFMKKINHLNLVYNFTDKQQTIVNISAVHEWKMCSTVFVLTGNRTNGGLI